MAIEDVETDLNSVPTEPPPVIGKVTRALGMRAMSFANALSQPDQIDPVHQCVLDWVGVALAGSTDPLATLLIDQAIEDGGQRVVTVMGRSQSVNTRRGAMINGAIGRAID